MISVSNKSIYKFLLSSLNLPLGRLLGFVWLGVLLLFFLSTSAQVYGHTQSTPFAILCILGFIFICFTYLVFEIPHSKNATNGKVVLSAGGAFVLLFWWMSLQLIYQIKLDDTVWLIYALVQISYIVLLGCWCMAKMKQYEILCKQYAGTLYEKLIEIPGIEELDDGKELSEKVALILNHGPMSGTVH